jgi:hypothetical protein
VADRVGCQFVHQQRSQVSSLVGHVVEEADKTAASLDDGTHLGLEPDRWQRALGFIRCHHGAPTLRLSDNVGGREQSAARPYVYPGDRAIKTPFANSILARLGAAEPTGLPTSCRPVCRWEAAPQVGRPSCALPRSTMTADRRAPARGQQRPTTVTKWRPRPHDRPRLARGRPDGARLRQVVTARRQRAYRRRATPRRTRADETTDPYIA